MARIAFVYDDQALASAGASAAAVTEALTGYPKENLIGADRKRRWQTTASPAGTINLDIDLGAVPTVPIGGFGILYLLSDAAAGAHPLIDERSGTNGDYSTGFASRATQTAAYWNDTRDWCDTFASDATYTDRYWRIACTSVGSSFSIGKIMLGSGKDFGKLYAAGSEFAWQVPTLRARTAAQEPVDWRAGEPRKQFAWNYRAQSDADRDIFQRLAQQRYPFAVLDSTGESNHVVLADGFSTPFGHVFDPLWNVGLTMEQMP